MVVMIIPFAVYKNCRLPPPLSLLLRLFLSSSVSVWLCQCLCLSLTLCLFLSACLSGSISLSLCLCLCMSPLPPPPPLSLSLSLSLILPPSLRLLLFLWVCWNPGQKVSLYPSALIWTYVTLIMSFDANNGTSTFRERWMRGAPMAVRWTLDISLWSPGWSKTRNCLSKRSWSGWKCLCLLTGIGSTW